MGKGGVDSYIPFRLFRLGLGLEIVGMKKKSILCKEKYMNEGISESVGDPE